MLSYRHAFHAGNHADVLKHIIEVQILRYLAQKEKPFWYIDTHAGAGLYSLTDRYAATNAEYESGIARLWHEKNLPESLAEYVDLVREFNPDGELRFYPGSPLLAEKLLRQNDQLHLFELHPTDYALLKDNFEGAGKRVKLYLTDGLKGVKALLPPQPRRGLVLIDPPYERNDEYREVPSSLEQGLKRFAGGVYAIWYPLLPKREATELPKLLAKHAQRWLHVTLQVKAAGRDGFGMYGSGMFVVNPPWTLLQTLEQTMTYIRDTLAQDPAASFSIVTNGLT
ncbi:MAG: 23S rRNA (adenine(2030)-N(6))-methyltransferase RlmJ [Gammaproteobacteria bacterium]|nr:23S rRNA (adenine(2030)-N(6))-methyltransferase RlmJ [Gammaproteobacteria bacterium]